MSMLVRLCAVILSLIVLYCIAIKMYITFPPADFPAVMSLWRLRSLSCVVFIFIPSFCHISSSSPNALLISVHFYPSHSDLYQIYSLMGWVLKWSGDTGEFYWYKWQLSPHALQSSRLLWNMKHSHSGFASTLIFFSCLNECNCCNFLPLINLLLLYYSRYNWCHNFNQLLTLSLWVKKVIEW